MAAALALLILLGGSLLIVRIASVALRLTGLPDHVARFQSVSALTGAGFTTTESESIVNFPIRRKVIVALMVFGNLGLVSVVSTFIVAFTQSAGDGTAMINQGLAIIATLVFIGLVMTNKTLDRLLCDIIGRLLTKLTRLKQHQYHMLIQVGADHGVAEHVYRGANPITAAAIFPPASNLTLLSLRGTKDRYHDHPEDSFEIARNETLICFGSDEAHQNFAEHLAKHYPFDPG